jgi:hypothetical protein
MEQMASTFPREADIKRARFARGGRRALVLLLAAFVGAGLAGVWGARTGTAAVTGGGYRLEVTYPSVTRPGLAIAWSVEIRRGGGFDGPVTLAVDPDYFEMFDENAMEPEPTTSRRAGDLVVWEFEPPEGDVLVVDLDARVEPGVQLGRSGSVAVLASGRAVVRISFHTRVVP